MRIAVVCNDTRGGIQPYVALALGLRSAGHDVRAIAPTDSAPMFSAVGLPVTAFTGSVQEVVASSAGTAERGSLATMRLAAREAPKFARLWVRELLAACEGVDVLTGGIGGMVVGLAVADALGRPFVEAQLQPIGVSSDAVPGVLLPGMPRLGGWGWRLSHRLSAAALWTSLAVPMRIARTELGLRGRSRATDGVPALYGFSRHVVPIDERGARARHVTGYWLMPEARDFRPPAGLEAFLTRPGPVVAIGFGSMSSADAEATTALVVGAARRAGARAVVVGGWGGLRSVPGDDVCFLESVPYEWLLERCAAVVHHGGAGTTGASLRSGRPTVVVPFMMDQPFWGARVAALGVGPAPIPRSRLTLERLAVALDRALTDEAMGARAAALGTVLRREDGVAAAVKVFDALS